MAAPRRSPQNVGGEYRISGELEDDGGDGEESGWDEEGWASGDWMSEISAKSSGEDMVAGKVVRKGKAGVKLDVCDVG